MPVKNHSDDDLEKIAEAFLTKHGKGKYDGRSLRVEALIESVTINGYRYTIFPVQGLAEIAEAYTPVMPGYIFIDEEQFLGGSLRCRFTLAEELAHILIHRPLFEGKSIQQIIKIQEGFSDADYRKIERNAKYLAGCLLMPRSICQERFDTFVAVQSQRVTNTLTIHRYAVRQLSRDFCVSCYSVALRVLKLGLFDQQEFDDLNESFGWKSSPE